VAESVKARYLKEFFKRLLTWTAVWAAIGGIDGFLAVGGARGAVGGLVGGAIAGAVGVLVGAVIAAGMLMIGAIGGTKRQIVTWSVVGLTIGLILFIVGITTGAEDTWCLGPIIVLGGAIGGAVFGLALGLTLVQVIEWGIGYEDRERIIIWGVAGAIVGAFVFGAINTYTTLGPIDAAMEWAGIGLIVGFVVGALTG
jgi:hypothetical protein